MADMRKRTEEKYLFVSVFIHSFILIMLIMGFDFSSPLPVLENTNKNDVISAVVLGDSPNNKILPKEINTPHPVNPKPDLAKNSPQTSANISEEKDVIALKAAAKKKLAEKKALEQKKQREKFAKDLLADIANETKKNQKVKQKELQKRFQKMLQQQAESSLRQQLLNEEITLKGTEVRQSRGEINKYKALILQSISEHWLIPLQANKKLYCELMIRLAPGGTVLDVQVVKSSGDPSLDSSARAAVLKASPLPVPQDAGAFAAFRQFILKVKPENVLTNEV